VVTKRSVSLADEVAKDVEQAAHEDGMSFSAWLSSAAERQLRVRQGLRGVAAFEAEAAGAAGVAVGALLRDGRVDVKRTRELFQAARPMKVTFHRAFDETNDLERALEDVILSGADCLLTSGGAANVLAGAEQIGRLQAQAGDRLEVMAGGGLKLANLAEVVRRSGVTCLHGSLARARNGDGLTQASVLEEDLREAIRLLQQECLEPAR